MSTVEPPPARKPPNATTHTAAAVDYSLTKLLAAFRCAFAGAGYMLGSQRNAQIHTLAATCALALGALLRIERWEWIALLLTIALVLAMEAVNTAIEATVDLATSSYHPLARIAKDVGAAAVLFCAIGAIIVGCIIFIPHLWTLLQGFIQY